MKRKEGMGDKTVEVELVIWLGLDYYSVPELKLKAFEIPSLWLRLSLDLLLFRSSYSLFEVSAKANFLTSF